MKRNWISKLGTTLIIGGALVMVPKLALAVGTPACTSIDNQATLTYYVGGTLQPTKDSNVANFVVGNKVMVAVTTEDVAAMTVVTNTTITTLLAADKYLTYKVTNGGNAYQDYALAVTAGGGSTIDPFDPADTDTDDFDVSNVSYFVEDGTSAGFQAGEDTATVITDLAPGDFKLVYVVPSGTGTDIGIPAVQSNNDTAVYILEATTLKSDGTTTEANSTSATIYKTADTTCTAAVQFAETVDMDWAKDGEAANDGKDTSRDTFKVVAAAIAVAKTSVVLSDPINGTNDESATFTASDTWGTCSTICPKAIPGAVIRYKISITNSSDTPATLTTIADTLAAELKIISASAGASWGVPASSRDPKLGDLTADTTNTDGLIHSDPSAVGGTLTATLATILPVDGGTYPTTGLLLKDETLNLVFDVTLQ